MPLNSKRECPSHQILNPVTYRCVSRTGKLGKMILKLQEKKKSSKELPKELPKEPKKPRGRPRKEKQSSKELPKEQPKEPTKPRGRPRKDTTKPQPHPQALFFKKKSNTSSLSPFSFLNNITRFNNYNKILKYLEAEINLSKKTCLGLYTEPNKYLLSNDLLLYKRIGSDSVYGIVYKCKNINPSYNIPKFTAKIQLKTKQALVEIAILTIITNYSIANNVPNLPIIYKIIECNSIDKGNPEYPTLLAKASKRSSNYLIILNELASGDLARFIEKYSSFFKHENFFKNLYEQIFISLLLIHSLGLSHNDCHSGNFLYHKIKPGGCFHYKINDDDYYIENIGFLWTVWDFGISSKLYRHGQYINDYMYVNTILRKNREELVTPEYLNHDFYKSFKRWGYFPREIDVNPNITKLQMILWKHLGQYERHNDITIISKRGLTEDLWLKFLLDNNYLFSKVPIGTVLSSSTITINKYTESNMYDKTTSFLIDKVKF